MADVLAFWAAALVVAAFGFPIGARCCCAGCPMPAPGCASRSGLRLRELRLLHPARAGPAARRAGAATSLASRSSAWCRRPSRAATAGCLVTWRRAWPGVLVAFGRVHVRLLRLRRVPVVQRRHRAAPSSRWTSCT